MTRYQLAIEAENLPGTSLWSRWFARESHEVYAEIVVTGGPQQNTVIGRTESHMGRRIQWIKTLFVETDPSIYMPLTIRVYKVNGTLLGEMTAEATAIFQSPGRFKTEKTATGIIITASIEHSRKGSSHGTAELHFRGLDIKNVEPGLLGLGRSDPGFEISKKSLDTTAGVVRWITVYRSEYIMNHLNPHWKEFTMDLEELCYCDLDWPLLIRVFDYQANGNHRVIGSFETTLQLMMNNVSVRGNADRRTAFEILKEGEDDNQNLHMTRGLIVIVKAVYH
ncbi:hypothetical protein MPSEU_000776800 [Mayamaea pseudoterrestris]|nr:hypothetical protein MPSEU_000776800 [Mayamaea pseudoterrestris]